jgi:hypothetical protein
MRQAIIFLLLAISSTPCSSDSNEAANKLFGEARRMIEVAEQQDPEERVSTLRAAEEKLRPIVGNYPGTDVALQLVFGHGIGKISLKGIARASRDAAWAVCVRTPRRGCILDEALRLWRSYEEEWLRDGALDHIARVHVKKGNMSEALQVAQSIKDELSRDRALREIVEAQADAGRISEALQLA